MSKRLSALASLGIGAIAFLAATSAQGALIINAKLTVPADPIVGIAATVGGATSTLASVGTVAATNNYPAAESPNKAIDNDTTAGSKYLNFLNTGSGFILTMAANGPSTLSSVRFFAGNDAPERDPLTITIEGTNSANPTTTLNSVWSPIYNGVTGLATDPGRNLAGASVPFAPATAGTFSSYRVLVSSVRTDASANSFQFSEIELVGSTPEPSAMATLAIAGIFGLRRRR